MECEYCNKVTNNLNHFKECEMLIAYLFDGCTSLLCQEETTIGLVSRVNRPNKLPITRWRTLDELCRELREMACPPNDTMYN